MLLSSSARRVDTKLPRAVSSGFKMDRPYAAMSHWEGGRKFLGTGGGGGGRKEKAIKSHLLDAVRDLIEGEDNGGPIFKCSWDEIASG